MGLMGKVFTMEDVNKIEEVDYSPLEPGIYDVELEKMEMKNTANGNGKYLHLTLKVISKKYSGRFLFTNLTVENPNPIAEEIGEKQFMILVKAGIESGLFKSCSFEQRQALIGLRFSVTVDIREYVHNGETKRQNDVKYFHSKLQAKYGEQDTGFNGFDSSNGNKSPVTKNRQVTDELNPPDFDDDIPF